MWIYWIHRTRYTFLPCLCILKKKNYAFIVPSAISIFYTTCLKLIENTNLCNISEYGFGSNPSTKGDVYSFGILVLEMVTRKRPTDDMFGGGLSLHKWVKSHFHGRVERVVDPSLVAALRDLSPLVKKMKEVAIGELMELGILCTQESSSTRPTMLDAADDLDRLKRYLTGDTTATFASSLGISSSTFDDD
jgi:hypothetical protein